MTFRKGQSGNPNGRPKVPEIEALRNAVKKVETEQGKRLLVHFVEQAYKDRSVMIALMKKFLPDLRAVDTKMAIQNGNVIFLPILTENDSELANTIKRQIGNSGLSEEPKAE